jgi:hypothetical protein
MTGMLLYHERAFVQVLSGSESAVKTLDTTISRETRHQIRERCFTVTSKNARLKTERWGYRTTRRSLRGDNPGSRQLTML